MTRKRLFFVIIAMVFISLNVYLFVSAPGRINTLERDSTLKYSSKDLFTFLAKLNDEARTLYTTQIVQSGKKSGLKFDENWKNKNVHAGPLPALFLRETSSFIEKSDIELGLYLGSDFPISQANQFNGIQKSEFEKIKENGEPRFFYDENTKRNFGMFPDYAIGNACVNCHNEHEESPKKDWVLNDIMGATTWSTPKDSLSTEELLHYMKTYLEASYKTYEKYLSSVEDFNTEEKPIIGKKWPSEGFYLPDAQTFKLRLDTLYSSYTLNELFIKQ